MSETWLLLCIEMLATHNLRFLSIHWTSFYMFCVIKIRKSYKNASNNLSELILCTAHHFVVEFGLLSLAVLISYNSCCTFVYVLFCCCALLSFISFSLSYRAIAKIRKIFTVVKTVKLNAIQFVDLYIFTVLKVLFMIYWLQNLIFEYNINDICLFNMYRIGCACFWRGFKTFSCLQLYTRT